MQNELSALLEKNKIWSERIIKEDPDFFKRLEESQKPQYLWIGCSDSRVPSSKIIDANPGEIFVHRNIANLVHHGDINLLSVLQYAVDALKVRHIILCGHYNCGGVKASLETTDHGLVDNWIRPVKEIYESNKEEFETLPEQEMLDKLCEKNVRQQALHLAQTTIVQKAWERGQALSVHGLIYCLSDGKLIDLACSIYGKEDLPDIYRVTSSK